MKPIVPNDSCLTQEQILRYLNDECQPSEVKAIDKHLTHCPMCSDAIEGAMLLDGKSLESSFAHIQTFIKEETLLKVQNISTESPTELTVVHKKSRRFLRTLLAIAASFTALVVAAIWLLTKPLESPNEASVANQAVSPQLKSEDSLYFAQKPVVIEQQTTVASADIPTVDKKLEMYKRSGDASVAAVSPEGTLSDSYQAPSTPPITANVEKIPNSTNSDDVASRPSEAPTAQDRIGYNNAPIPASAKISSESAISEDNIALQSQEGESLKETRAANTKMATPAKKKQAFQGEKDREIFEQGVNFLQNKDYKNAIGSFNTVITENKTNTRNDLYEKSLWYIANTYFMMNDKAKAKSYYQQIAKSKSAYAPQAETILKNWKE